MKFSSKITVLNILVTAIATLTISLLLSMAGGRTDALVASEISVIGLVVLAACLLVSAGMYRILGGPSLPTGRAGIAAGPGPGRSDLRPRDGAPKAQFNTEGAAGGTTELSETTHEGEVKWFNPRKGFGFISRADGEDVFVHFRSVVGEDRYLRPGQTVRYIIVRSERGFQAENVHVTGGPDAN